MCVIVMSDIFGVDYVTLVFVLAYIFILFLDLNYFYFEVLYQIGTLADTLKFVWSYWSEIEAIFLIISKLSKSGICIRVKFALRDF